MTDIEIRAAQSRGNRQNATTERFAHHQDIGRYIVMVASKHPAGFAEARRDLVEDEQRAVGIAGLAHGAPIAGRWQIRHGARRFGDDSGNVTLALQHVA